MLYFTSLCCCYRTATAAAAAASASWRWPPRAAPPSSPPGPVPQGRPAEDTEHTEHTITCVTSLTSFSLTFLYFPAHSASRWVVCCRPAAGRESVGKVGGARKAPTASQQQPLSGFRVWTHAPIALQQATNPLRPSAPPTMCASMSSWSSSRIPPQPHSGASSSCSSSASMAACSVRCSEGRER